MCPAVLRAGLLAASFLFANPFSSGPSIPDANAQDDPGREISREAQTEEEIYFEADNVTYDREKSIIRATGNVEAAYAGRVLFADEVSYNQLTGVAAATGNVRLTDTTGDVLFADSAELGEGLRNGVIRGLYIRLSDNSRMAAISAERERGVVTRLNRAVYSPCEICAQGGDPLWQLKAYRVTHDKEDRTITYEDAFLEVYGVPVFYTPYLQHPDPSVERKTGFLAPSFGRSTELGTKLEVPFYWELSPHQDLTISPLYTSKDGVLGQAEWRRRTRRGGFDASGSLIYTDELDIDGEPTGENELRGHLFVESEFGIDEHAHWGLNVERSTDDTFLQRYSISDLDTLTSRLYAERFDRRSYGAIDFILFQGLDQEDDPGLTPMILPQMRYSLATNPSSLGSYFTFDFNGLLLQRREGLDTRRVSLSTGWQLPYTSSYGELYTLFADVRGDLYFTDDVPNSANPMGADGGGFVGRVLPRIGLDWRLPFVRNHGSIREVLEPIVQIIYAPYGGNPGAIPNEDSGSFEFDDTNLFSLNRFTGLDQWEGGPRANIGVKWSAYGNSGGYTTVVFGQVLRLRDDATFAADTGLDQKRSDYVGRVVVAPSRFFDLTHRFRLDKDDFGYRRAEVYASMGPDFFRAQLGYVKLAREETDIAIRSREEINGTLRIRFNQEWSAAAGGRRDLSDDGSMVSANAGIFYIDECIELGLTYDRRFTRDRDVEPSTSVNFRIRLKHLG